jgi:SAM-dependent methyltransferase
VIDLLPRRTLAAGAIIRWHLVGRWLSEIASGRAGTRWLDVGCGGGEYVFRIARRFPRASLVVGLDQPGRDGVSAFERVPDDVAARVSLREGWFSRAAVSDVAPFDAVLCVDVLEHVSDHCTFLSDLAAIVRPRARALVHVPATPQHHPIPSVRHALARMLLDRTGEHVREGYALREVCALLGQTGWAVRRVRSTFGPIAAFWCDADFYLAGRKAHALRAAALPLTLAGAMLGAVLEPAHGNGWLLLLERDAR